MIGSLSQEEIYDLLRNHYVGHIACADGDGPYVVPFTYFFDEPTKTIVGYTTEGRKANALRADPRVCINVTDVSNLSHWRSVVIEGRFEELGGMESVDAIRLLITKLKNRINAMGIDKVDSIADMTPNEAAGSKIIYRIHISEMNGRFEKGGIRGGVSE
jgi:nitroimidazol reductase NimA-like FMN-containing flavoprotein (pyridoxamine 5'-phosphate oxidase superfamily)